MLKKVTLSEVSIMADQGSSGAPMLNGKANVVGLLHSGAKKSMCYFVSLEDIRTALLEWGTRCCVPYFHHGFHCSLETRIISMMFFICRDNLMRGTLKTLEHMQWILSKIRSVLSAF